MVLACESIFSRTSLDGRPRNLRTFSKINMKYTKRTFPVGQARCSFHLPHSYNLQILLARGNGASTNVEPWHDFLNLGIANAVYWLLPWSPSIYLTLLSLPDAMDSLDERVKTFFKKCSTPATKQENADEHFSKIKTVSLLANNLVISQSVIQRGSSGSLNLPLEFILLIFLLTFVTFLNFV